MTIFELLGTMNIAGLNETTSGLSALGGVLSGIGSAVKSAGDSLTANLTKPIMDFAKQGLQFNSTIEDLQTSFKVMLGSEEKAIKMTNDLKKMGADTPFEITGLAESTETLLAFGYTQEDVIPVMKRLGDVSLGNKEKFKGLSFVMGQINSLGKLQAGDLNQLIGRGWNPLNEITAKTGETMEEVRDRMSKGKVTYKEVEQALIDATDKGGKFYNGMAEGSKTLSGKLSTLADTFNDLLGKATDPLFNFLRDKAVPIMTELVDSFANLSEPVLITIGVFAGLLAAVGPVLIAIGSFIGVVGGLIIAGGAIAGVFATIGPLATAIITGFTLIVGAVLGVVTAFLGLVFSSEDFRTSVRAKLDSVIDKFKAVKDFVVENFDTIKKAFYDFVDALNTGDFSSFTMTMLNLIPKESKDDFLEFMKNFIDFYDKVIMLRDSLIDFSSTVYNKIIEIKDGMIDFVTTIGDILTPIFTMLKNAVSNIDFDLLAESFKTFKESLEPILPLIQDLAIVFGTSLATGLGIVYSILSTIITIIPNVIGIIMGLVGIVASALGIIKAVFTGNFELIEQSTINLWNSIASIWKNAWSMLKNGVGTFIDSIVGYFKNLYNILVGNSIVPDMINSIINWFKQLPGKVYSAVLSLISQAVSGFNNLKNSIVNIVTSLVSSAVNTFTGIVSKFISVVSNVKSQAVSKFNEVKSGIINVLSGINLFSIGQNIIQGLINGLSSLLGTLKNIASDIANTVKNAIKDKLKISSPSKVMIDLGKNTMEGFVAGLDTKNLKFEALNLADSFKNGFSSFKDNAGTNISNGSDGSASINNKKEGDFIIQNVTIDASSIEDISSLIDIFKNIKSEAYARGGAF